MKEQVTIFWFRRDLRLEDNTGLFFALKENKNVLPVFIFDRNILDKLLDKSDHRVSFVYDQVIQLNQLLKAYKSGLFVAYGGPENAFEKLCAQYKVRSVYTNRDYEPYARERDEKIRTLLNGKGIEFFDFKDQVIFEKDEILNDANLPFKVFTPYSKKWKVKFNLKENFHNHDASAFFNNLFKFESRLFSLEELGFKKSVLTAPKLNLTQEIVSNYSKTRDYPAIQGTTKVSIYLRFGLISIRKLMELASRENEVYLNELIWREFYQMILWFFPETVTKNFKSQYNYINWDNNFDNFERWKHGMTGFPLVDAGMRELNKTGFMHNRLRMITASFLTKNLLIDWRLGERYFAEKLFDFELASNVGGWQWAASTGVDSVPYFRIFNPETQIKRFDEKFEYIRSWVPEYGTSDYSKPMIDYKLSRERAIFEFGNSNLF